MIAFYTEWLGVRDINASILAKPVTRHAADDHDAELKHDWPVLFAVLAHTE